MLEISSAQSHKVDPDQGLPNALTRRGAFGNSGSRDIGPDDTHIRLQQKGKLAPEVQQEFERILIKRRQEQQQ